MNLRFNQIFHKVGVLCLLFIFLKIGVVIGQNTVGTLLNTSKSFDGYTLITPNKGHASYLINNCGEIINKWKSEYISETASYLTEEGHLIKTCISPRPTGAYLNGTGGWIEIRDWDNEIVWSHDFNSETETTNHDLKLLPNGNLLIIFAELVDEETTYQLGRKQKEPMIATVVKEIEMIGKNDFKVVWEWKIKDHLIQDIDPNRPNYGNIRQQSEKVNINYQLKRQGGSPIRIFRSDFFHANAIDYNPKLDQILLTFKHYAEIMVIDHSTTTEEAAGSTGGSSGKGGDILFRYGNPETYSAGTWEDRILFAPHSGIWIKEGLPNEGHFMVFNNGKHRPRVGSENSYSDVMTFASPLKLNGNYGLKESYNQSSVAILFQYGGKRVEYFNSSIMSNVQPLPNGNILINVARGSRILEITPEKELVWDYRIPANQDLLIDKELESGKYGAFNVQRYPTDMVGFAGKDLRAKGMFGKLKRTEIDCKLYQENKLKKLLDLVSLRKK